jgi:thiol-disulfide isomerase/thioredoxin
MAPGSLAVPRPSTVAANESARHAAFVLLAIFGLTLLFPTLADGMARPIVAWGVGLSDSSRAAAPFILGIGTGLLWTPCAGPILGTILTGAALRGANAGSSLLLLAYAAGACTSLAGALLFGGRLLSSMKRALRVGDGLRRVAGAAVVAGVAAIALGLDVGVLGRLSFATTSALEDGLVQVVMPRKPQAPPEPGTSFDRAALVRVSTAADPAGEASARGVLTSLASASEWINSPPLTADSLRGKVVLVDFWTYSCINCLRTPPYVRAWSQKYKDAGLVVVGVHAPEFSFERRPANVRRATKDLHIDFPVAIDNDFAVWRAFGNQAWPAFYFIDTQGRVRHRQFGEDRYAQAEQLIQQLLAEAGRGAAPTGVVAPHGQGVEASPGPTQALSQETCLGHERATGYASRARIVRDRANDYPPATGLRTHQWALTGTWTVAPERVVLDRPGGRIAYRFHARDLHLVLGPAADGRPLRFKVLIDGKPPGEDHGSDIDALGYGTIDAHKLYQLVRQGTATQDRLFEIEFLDAGAQAYVFTFG